MSLRWKWRLTILAELICDLVHDGYGLIEKFAEKLNEFAMRVA